MRPWLAFTLLFLLSSTTLHGCIQIGPDESGDDDGLGPAPFAGDWVRPVADGGCTQGRVFNKKNGAFAYEVDLICPLTSGGVGVQAEVGTYDYDPESGITTFTPQRSTCRGRSTDAYTQIVSLSGPYTLLVETNTSIEMYTSSPFPVMNPTPGCFDASGGFTPSPLAAL